MFLLSPSPHHTFLAEMQSPPHLTHPTGEKGGPGGHRPLTWLRPSDALHTDCQPRDGDPGRTENQEPSLKGRRTAAALGVQQWEREIPCAGISIQVFNITSGTGFHLWLCLLKIAFGPLFFKQCLQLTQHFCLSNVLSVLFSLSQIYLLPVNKNLGKSQTLCLSFLIVEAE